MATNTNPRPDKAPMKQTKQRPQNRICDEFRGDIEGFIYDASGAKNVIANRQIFQSAGSEEITPVPSPGNFPHR
jgi:hypothetical protein